MHKLMLWSLFLIPSLSFGQANDVNQAIRDKYLTASFTGLHTTKDLANKIAALSLSNTEQLQLLLLWTSEYMEGDANRFFNENTLITPNEAMKAGKGLCADYSSIFDEVCNYLNIPTMKIEGYVRELNFKPQDVFKASNHVWNMVFIDSSWKLCDLFWSTSVLQKAENDLLIFEKTLRTKYYLASPSEFIGTHLPIDPVFQFDATPIKLEAFTNVETGIDSSIERLNFHNYQDSIKLFQKLSLEAKQIKISRNAYRYNIHNPNSLIVAYYNDAVPILNNKASKKQEFQRVKNNLNTALKLIEESDDESIIALAPLCKEGIEYLNKLISRK